MASTLYDQDKDTDMPDSAPPPSLSAEHGFAHPFARLAGSASVWDAQLGARSAPAEGKGEAHAAYAEGVLTGAVRAFAGAHSLAEADVYAWLARR